MILVFFLWLLLADFKIDTLLLFFLLINLFELNGSRYESFFPDSRHVVLEWLDIHGSLMLKTTHSLLSLQLLKVAHELRLEVSSAVVDSSRR